MKYIPLSPFMRSITHAHLYVDETPKGSVPGKPVNKWAVLRELSKAQAKFGITERDLTVLQGLLSFFQHDVLTGHEEMIVFPSNNAICERLNGMPCSTMRRHLARLVSVGLIIRRDSPNGKRYARKYGAERVAFGFDLSPLHCRFGEITCAAAAVGEERDRVRRLRESVSLMRRDLLALADFGAEVQPELSLWGQLHEAVAVIATALRRKLSIEDLNHYFGELEVLINEVRNMIGCQKTASMSTSDAQDEQHYHNTNKEYVNLEDYAKDRTQETQRREEPSAREETTKASDGTHPVKGVPLHMVITACPSLTAFYQGEIRHWHQLFDAASQLRVGLGISASTWNDAQKFMGREQASIVIAAILQRLADIRSPGAYLRALTARAMAKKFSCGPMITALLFKQNTA